MPHFFRAMSLPVLLGIALAPAAALAQGNTHLNIAAGMSLPTGDFGDAHSVGYNVIGGIGSQSRTSALGFRIEGLFTEFEQEGTDRKSRVIGATANALYNLTAQNRSSANSLYIIGGVGYYNTRLVPFTSSQSNIGMNVGGGFQFPLTGFSAYIEARYHAISDQGVRFVPISFGLVF